MKKFITTILALSITMNIFSLTAFAICETDAEGNIIDMGDCLYPRPGEAGYDLPYREISDDLKAVGDLPNVDTQGFFVTSIKFILSGAMLLTIIALVVASIYYIMSRGEEEAISKAKNIILYLIIGIAIMAASYGIVAGIVQFEFF